MPNGNIKTNKTKMVARVMLVILLISSAINLAGCTKTISGYYYPYDFQYYLSQETRGDDSSIIKIWATSDSNIFDMNDIRFNLLYGTHANKYLDIPNDKGYDLEYYLWYGDKEYQNYTFALYICDLTLDYENKLYSRVDNIENIADHQFIKSISSEEAFSDEYGYVVKQQLFLSNFYYKHIEKITIPKKYIKEDGGCFIIKLVAYYYVGEEKLYSPEEIEYIRFDYEKIEGNVVKINFNANN